MSAEHFGQTLKVLIPGYGEDPDMVQPFTDQLSEVLGDEVAVADLYEKHDRKFYRGAIPSQTLAQRVVKQLGLNGMHDSVIPIGHSFGSRVASHFSNKPNEVMIAPEGREAGDADLVVHFTRDVLSRLITGPQSNRRFAAEQAFNVLRRPVASFGQAREMATTSAFLSPGQRALIIEYDDDSVIAHGHIRTTLRKHPQIAHVSLPGDHYEPFENPGPTAALVAQYLNESSVD